VKLKHAQRHSCLAPVNALWTETFDTSAWTCKAHQHN